ncbi:tumor necrosis factor ligand superfamily member 14 [Etheostoma cragini]|uniref:tumor necrosis factor ligand superfamily member 14 n=1 Tax=Etheostoma cragini TaxID=417921 RepID=UPI00155EF541|nr:tumor necrosis factor ligand superfamily member 14 [Etheostoma cragini]
MSKDGYPSVYVVDTNATRPPLPPRLSQGRQRAGVAQTLLILLVSVALCGMVIEACFIYRLYQPESAPSASSSKLTAGEVISPSVETPSHVFPSKPVAHLTDGQDVIHEKHIMAWSMNADPLLYEMDYKDRGLVIQKEGYYYVYSKVSFFVTDSFNHSVIRKTDRYFGGEIPLLMSRKHLEKSGKMRSNSYLGGVFHLTKDDVLFVKVSDTSNIWRHSSFENIFGAYMI